MTLRTVLLAAATTLAGPALALDCEPGLRPFAHPGGETCIPEDPQRIVTLQDQNGLLPLLELGVTPVGSAGHILEDGTQVFRRTEGYDTSGVAFVGTYGEPDREAVAALAPDLIIASPWPAGQAEAYAAIAPTIVFDPFSQPLDEALLQLADAVGRTEEAERLQAETEAHAGALRAELGDRLDRATLSFITPDLAGGLFYPENGTQAAGVAFRLLDLTRVPAQGALGPDDQPELSWEALPEHAGDLLFAFTYDAEDQGGEFDRVLALPVVQALPVARAGQVVEIDGTETVGSAWGKVRVLMDRVAEALRRDDLNLNFIAE